MFRSQLVILIALPVSGCTRESDRAERRTDSRTSEAEGSAAQVHGTAGGPLRGLALTDVGRASDEDRSSRIFAERSVEAMVVASDGSIRQTISSLSPDELEGHYSCGHTCYLSALSLTLDHSGRFECRRGLTDRLCGQWIVDRQGVTLFPDSAEGEFEERPSRRLLLIRNGISYLLLFEEDREHFEKHGVSDFWCLSRHASTHALLPDPKAGLEPGGRLFEIPAGFRPLELSSIPAQSEAQRGDVVQQADIDTGVMSDDVRSFVLHLQQLVDAPDYATAERLYSELIRLTHRAPGEWALLNNSLAGTEFQPMAELLQSKGPVDLFLGDDSAAQRHLSLFGHKSDAVRWLAVRSATFDNSEILVATKFGLLVERYATRERRDQIASSLAMALRDRNAGVRLAALRGLMWCYEEELIPGATLLGHATVVKGDMDESVTAQAQRVLRGLRVSASADAD